jgi:hypothetical protein
MGDDLDACRLPIKEFLALYIGGMGSKRKNYYKNFAVKLGYEDAATKIQELYLSGKKEQATQEVPDELVDEIALTGPKQRIQDQAEKWLAKREFIKTIICKVTQAEVLPVLKEVLDD